MTTAFVLPGGSSLGAVQVGMAEALMGAGVRPDLIAALLSSTAIPGIFPPVPFGDRTLIDGGIAADTPISEAVALGANRVFVLPTVGVDDGGRPRGASGVALRAMAHLLGHASEGEI